MNNYLGHLRDKLKEVGCTFSKEEQPGIERVYWHCFLDGQCIATEPTLGRCIKVAAELLGEM